ncbi:spindlin interactor and repressor of chromatin-binding protein isoform X2 [Hemicordylus capensis]|nr:spindlin interactor and repressor of chromatin-binding protein isoform X2 [Hemicordylus capensis]
MVPASVPRAAQEEPSGSWRQEYLIAKSSAHDRLVCMVCGGVLRASGPMMAREHILQHHAHSLDFSLEEKRNILEAWSEGAALPEAQTQLRPAGNPIETKKPAEIEVLLDSEEQPASRKRGPMKPSCEAFSFNPRRQAQGQRRWHSSGNAKAAKGKQTSKDSGKEWPSQGGVPGSAPAEIRIFTDGTFPAGFALKLYCRPQPEPAQNASAKPGARKGRTDRDCSVSLLRLRSPHPSGRLGPSQGNPAGSILKDCGAKPGQRAAAAAVGKQGAPLLAESVNPAWRSRFLMDFDAAAGQLVCMVCESTLRRVSLAAVKQHILQCHSETLQLPREVRRTIREVWESRGPRPAPAARK